MKKNAHTQKNAGYALYTSIILTSILILVAYATANLSIQQLQLSVEDSESHIAFYNADSGLECALYADLKSGGTSAFDVATTTGAVHCNGQTITTGSQTVQTSPTQPSKVGGGGVGSLNIFQLNFTIGCAIVEVTKNADGTTLIQSRGYNTCSGSRQLERGVQEKY